MQREGAGGAGKSRGGSLGRGLQPGHRPLSCLQPLLPGLRCRKRAGAPGTGGGLGWHPSGRAAPLQPAPGRDRPAVPAARVRSWTRLRCGGEGRRGGGGRRALRLRGGGQGGEDSAGGATTARRPPFAPRHARRAAHEGGQRAAQQEHHAARRAPPSAESPGGEGAGGAVAVGPLRLRGLRLSHLPDDPEHPPGRLAADGAGVPAPAALRDSGGCVFSAPSDTFTAMSVFLCLLPHTGSLPGLGCLAIPCFPEPRRPGARNRRSEDDPSPGWDGGACRARGGGFLRN